MTGLRKSKAEKVLAEGGFSNTPLRQRLKEALLRRILGGHYDPGERLVELRIAVR